MLLLLVCLLVQAQDYVRNDLHCGQLVTLTAAPDEGYRFVGWSDGNTDNPRTMEITQSLQLEALYEKSCGADEKISLVYLYDKLIMIDRAALKQSGFDPSEEQVVWYRIVGDIDQLAERNDQPEAHGYYINKTAMPAGAYYAELWLHDAVGEQCAEALRSPVVYIGYTGLPSLTDKKKYRKIIRDERLLILIDDKIYDAWGRSVP